ncbi:hypothetical protein HMPREF9413_2501 [Paenibacillus sp. HGF7]|nr:hypothetical protein HMPREF9413_2501 [Paenibacillus sp. HGF7]
MLFFMISLKISLISPSWIRFFNYTGEAVSGDNENGSETESPA